MRLHSGFLTALAVFFTLPTLGSAEDLVLLRKIGIEGESVVLDLSAQAKVQVLPILDPPSLVVDLANTRNRARPKSVEGSGLIRRVRSSQFQPGPDWAARVVVDLSAMAGYQVKWDAGRLLIVLHGAVQPASEEPAEAPGAGELLPGMSKPMEPAPAVQTPPPPPADAKPAKKGRKGRKAAQAEPAAEPEDVPAPAPAPSEPAKGPSSEDLLPPSSGPAPADRKPAPAGTHFLKVGPFPDEEALKAAQDELSSLGYGVAPLKGK